MSAVLLLKEMPNEWTNGRLLIGAFKLTAALTIGSEQQQSLLTKVKRPHCLATASASGPLDVFAVLLHSDRHPSGRLVVRC